MRFISYVRRPSMIDRLLFIAQGFAHILDGLVMIVGLGFFVPRFTLDIACLRARLFLRAQANKLPAAKKI